MEEFVVYNGKLEWVDSVDRGVSLVFAEAEWRERADAGDRGSKKEFLRIIYASFALPFGYLIIAILIFHGHPWWTEPEIVVYVIAFFSMLLAFPIVLVVLETKARDLKANLPTPGLYENGFQAVTNWFVPYEEIDDIERRSKPPSSGKEEEVIISIVVKYMSGPNQDIRTFTMTEDFFSSEGVEVLYERWRQARSEAKH